MLRYRVYGLFLLFLCCAAPAHAQDAIEQCREAANDAKRIACLEAALSRQSGGSAAPDAPPAAGHDVPVPASPDVPEAVPSADRDPVPDRREHSRNAEPAAAPEPAADRTQLNPESAPASGSEEPAAADIGAEQLARRRGRDEADPLASARALAVARYDYVPFDRLQVTLENGQVWLQITGDTQHIRASLRKNSTVDIEESSLGGYKLRLNEMRRTIRVERIR